MKTNFFWALWVPVLMYGFELYAATVPSTGTYITRPRFPINLPPIPEAANEDDITSYSSSSPSSNPEGSLTDATPRDSLATSPSSISISPEETTLALDALPKSPNIYKLLDNTSDEQNSFLYTLAFPQARYDGTFYMGTRFQELLRDLNAIMDVVKPPSYPLFCLLLNLRDFFKLIADHDADRNKAFLAEFEYYSSKADMYEVA